MRTFASPFNNTTFMKTRILLLRFSGAICLFFMLSHCAFQSAFHWEQTLNCLSVPDKAIFLTYHYIIILVLGFMSILLLLQPGALLISPLRFSILGTFILFYIIRIITEFTLFGYTPQSPVILIMCIVPVILWLVSLFSKNN
jgi:hypothetical protein